MLLPPFFVIEANPELVVKVEVLVVRSSGGGILEIDGKVDSIFWWRKMQNMNVTFQREYEYLSYSNVIFHDGVNSLNV